MASQTTKSTAPSAERPGPVGTHSAPPYLNYLQPLSCTRCAQRKVRCDRLYPCANCNKHDVACEFPPPKTERRKRKKPSTTSTRHDNLNEEAGRCQDTRQQPNKASIPSTSTSQTSIPLHASSVYYTGGVSQVSSPHDLDDDRHRNDESSARHEFSGNASSSESSSGDSDDGNAMFSFEQQMSFGMMLYPTPTSTIGPECWPSQQHFSILWQTYLSNIHPVTMIFHAPTTGKLLARAVQDYDHASKHVKPLLFGTMACALMSMSDAECVRKLAAKRSKLLLRYQTSCQTALMKARLSTSSNIRVLQAYAVFLLAIHQDIDPCTLWHLTGIAKRNARRLGLHAQAAPTNTVDPFEMEMRSRLWRHISWLDIMAAHLSNLHADLISMPRQPCPTRINDSELHPGMTTLPKEAVGASDMMFCDLRYRTMAGLREDDDDSDPSRTTSSSITDSNGRLDDLQRKIELDILRFCDTLNPVHLLTTIVARSSLCYMRFASLQATQRRMASDKVPAKERDDALFATALKVLEYDSNAHGHPSIQGLLWHMQLHFPWPCLVHVLEELIKSPTHEQAGKIWEQVHMVFSARPCLSCRIRHNRNQIVANIQRLMLEAWRLHEIAASECGHTVVTPPFVASLRTQAHDTKKKGKRCVTAPMTPSVSTGSTIQTPKDPPDSGLTQLCTTVPASAIWQGWPSTDLTAANPQGVDLFDFNAPFDHDMSMSLLGYEPHFDQIPEVCPSTTSGG